VGRELGVSAWLTVDQPLIDRYAEATGDHQWIHVDVERARRESPTGSTIAHGYLVLSLVARFGQEVGIVPTGASHVLNYGLDKVRFLAPVRAGARVRDRILLVSAEAKGPGRLLIKAQHTVEVEGEDRSAMIAESLALVIAKGGGMP